MFCHRVPKRQDDKPAYTVYKKELSRKIFLTILLLTKVQTIISNDILRAD